MGLDEEQLNIKKEDHSQKAFVTFYHYLYSLQIARETAGWTRARSFLSDLKMRNLNIQRRPLSQHEIQRLRVHLFMMWGRQAALEHLKDASEDHLSIALQGLFQDLYYIFYHAAQAYLTASGKPPVDDHAGLLKVLSRDIKRFPGHLAGSCSIVADGSLRFFELPDPNPYVRASNLSIPTQTSYHCHLQQLLKTTRDKVLDRKLESARKRLKLKRLTSETKLQESLNLEPITLFHFLYRLRCRFDYADAETILCRPIKIKAQDFYRVLLQCFSDITISLEWLVVKYAGPEHIRQISDMFASKNKENASAANTLAKIDYRLRAYSLKDAA